MIVVGYFKLPDRKLLGYFVDIVAMLAKAGYDVVWDDDNLELRIYHTT